MNKMMKKIVLMIVAVMMISVVAITTNAKTVLKENRLVVTQGKFGTKVKWMGKTIRWYDFNGKVKLVNGNQLTEKKLIKRKNKVLYIERITGKVINNRLDGRTTDGYYISYRCMKGKVNKGDTIITYCVYNPYTHWIDDIDERYDVIKRKARWTK